VEHNPVRKCAMERNISLDSNREKMLLQYAESILEANKKFNITGFQSILEIIENLIIGSIDPVRAIKVPRGTAFADIGTGAGIPGIPLALFCDAWHGTLIDSNNKKTSFIKSVIEELKLDNLRVYNGRLEELAHAHLRGTFDFVFSRALGDMYIVLECGAPLLKREGLLYIYSKVLPEKMHSSILDHGAALGLSLVLYEEFAGYGIDTTGILFRKIASTDNRYPRNMAVMKREIRKLSALLKDI
jgi:16S rRNA (guanine527-N7)-methyltransferase